MKANKKRTTNILLLIFSAGVFILIGLKTDWVKTWDSVQNANILWILLATVIMLMSHIFRGIRWTLLTAPAGFPLNRRRSFYSVMSGYLVNVATSRGGEFARCALTASSEKAPLELLIGTVVTERLVDLIMLLTVCATTLILQFEFISGFFTEWIVNPVLHQLESKYFIVFVIVGLLLIAGIVFFRRNRKKGTEVKQSFLRRTISRFAEGLLTVFRLKNPWLFLGYSLGIWTCYWLGSACMLKSMPVTEHLNIFNALGVLVFASIGIAIPLPAGAGVWGTVSLGLTSVYHLTSADAETFAIFNVAFSNLFMIVFGALSYLLLFLEIRKIKANDS